MDDPNYSPHWRQSVRDVMFAATQKEAMRRYGTAEPVFNYRWEHVKSVVNLSLKLAHLLDADSDIAEAAAWLHDVCKEEAKQEHHTAGAQFARDFLPKTDFPSEKIGVVAHAIADHTGLWRGDPWPEAPLADLYSQILWDADKLAKIGTTAVFHWTGMNLAKSKKQWTTEDFIENGRKQDWIAKTVASMHTEPARHAAQARLRTYNKLWDILEAELKGDDLLP